MENFITGKKNTKGLLDRLIECNTFDPFLLVDFRIGDIVVGKIHKNRLDIIEKEATVFQIGPEGVTLHASQDTAEKRTAALDEVLRKWNREDIITGWRDENYRVSPSFDSPPLMEIERSAAAFFGIMGYGVHLNGITTLEGQPQMWMARRSAQKAKFPGYLDHLVAGGVPAGMNARDTLIKECAEEAGIPEALARQARPAGAVYYCKQEIWGLEREILFIYDLHIPETFSPNNTDGEVAEFFLWPIEQVMSVLADSHEVQPCCQPVMIDFLVRHGYLSPEDCHYLEIIRGLWGFEEQWSTEI
ncbi:MAG: DUF4743 domain-containing protein [SAR324 cluster bacterium]|nr:DUF4743 domain-containing protein [SAR324 cluster bacterium]